MSIGKCYDATKLSAAKREHREDILKNLSGSDQYMTGVNGDRGFRVQPDFLQKADRKVIQNPDGAAAIIMDNNPEYTWVDRGPRNTGGGDFASRIHIVAGIRGHLLGEANDEHPDGLNKIGEIFHRPLSKGERLGAFEEADELKYHSYTPIEDAAGLYLNQRGNPQAKFALKAPNLGGSSMEWAGMSDVTAYADVVQLVGRQAVNIYGGLPQSSTIAAGAKNTEHMGVNLIWGNAISDYAKNPEAADTLEPLVKSRKLEKALDGIIDRISELKSAVDKIARRAVKRDGQLAFHTHPAMLYYTTPSPDAVASWASGMPSQIYELIDSAYAEINKALLRVNTSPMSQGSFASDKNKTN